MSDNTGQSKAFFRATAMPDADWWSALWPDPQAVVRKLGIDSGMRVVDLCCGDGHFTVALAGVVGVLGHVWGIDLNADLLAQARVRVEKSGGGRQLDWVLADACVFPDLEAEPFDAIFLANTFHGVPQKETLVRSIHRVLKPGGAFIVVNWHKRERDETPVLGQPRGPQSALRLSPRQTADFVLPVGFDLHGVVDVGPYHYGAVFTKV